MAVTAASNGRLRHLALFYQGRGEYLSVLGGFVRAGRARGEAVLVAVPRRKAQLVRRELGDDSAQVTLVDMAELGRNPARIIPAVLAYAGRHPGQHVCFIGEPIWPGRTAAELQEATRHEALINLAFRDSPVTFVCPYDRTRLPRSVIADAASTHPGVIRGGGRRPAPGTWGRRRFRRDVTGHCPVRPLAPRRWATARTCARFAASSPAGPGLPG